MRPEGTARAKVAELVDALALGASGVTRESSSLSFRTKTCRLLPSDGGGSPDPALAPQGHSRRPTRVSVSATSAAKKRSSCSRKAVCREAFSPQSD